MALTIEIWVSTGGIGEGSFTLLDTIPDPGTGFTFDHAPVTPGQLYIYRARRRDDSQAPDCQYSDWSDLAFMRGAYTEGNGMSSCAEKVYTGNLTAFYLAIESCEGIPTQAQWAVEYFGGGINRDDRRVYGRSFRNATTMRRKVVKGIVTFEGSIEVEITPEGPFPRLMGSMYPVTTTDLVTPTRYRHRFSNKTGGWTLTLIQLKGETYFVYPGCRATSVSFAFSKEQDGVLTATFTVVALDELIWEVGLVPTAATLLGVDVAPTDPLPPYGAAFGLAEIANADADMRSLNLDLTANVRRKMVWDGTRGAKKSFANGKDVTASAGLFWSDKTNLRRDLGVVAPAGAYGVGDKVITAPVSLEFNPPANGSGFVNILGFYFPAADLISSQQVNDENEIPEALTIVPVDEVGGSEETDFFLELTNTEPNEDLTEPGAAIVAIPSGVLSSTAKKYLYGVVTGTPSTTSIAAANSTHLLNVDDTYNGKTLRFLTGTQAGTSRAISDYTGATRTFTTAAFPGAPAVGDIFEII